MGVSGSLLEEAPHNGCWTWLGIGQRSAGMIIEALCAAPPEALAHNPSQSQRELHKDGGGGGGGIAKRARAARAPKAKFCTTPCAASLFSRPRSAPRPSRARPSRVDRHCHWACSTNSRFQTLKGCLTRRWAQRLEGTRTPIAADGHHSGQHAAAHADPQGQGKLRPDARGCLRGKGLDELRDTFTLPFVAAPSTSTATSCAKSLPSFAAPSTSSATFCSKSFTC